MLVVRNVLLQIPLLFDVFEISSQLRATSISFFEGEIFPKLFVEKLINWSIAVDACSRVAIPVPDTTAGGTFLEDLDIQTLFSQTCTDQQYTVWVWRGTAYRFINVNDPNPAPTRRTSSSTIGSSIEPMFTVLFR